MLENSRMTQTDQEIAGSARFFRSLLDMKCPAEIYQASPRPYQGLPDIDYPFHDRTIVVTHCGRICLGKKKINFSMVFAGQAVGIKEVQDEIWLVSLWIMIWATSIWRRGCSNHSKIRSVRKCYLCSRYRVSPMCPVWTQGLWSGRWESNPRPKLGKLTRKHVLIPPTRDSNLLANRLALMLRRVGEVQWRPCE